MAEPGFVLEVMPYIGVLQVIVYIGDGPPQNLKLNLRPRDLELTFTKPEAGPEGYKLALNLLQEVKTDNAVLTQNRRAKKYHQYLHYCSFRALNAGFAALHCFAPSSRKPSAHWQELSDLWICHRAFFDVVPVKDVKPQPGTIVLGDTSVLVHEKDIAPNTLCLARDNASAEQTPIPVLCSRCKLPLGSASVVRSAYSEVQLFYHALASKASPNAFSPFTVETLASISLRDAVRDHQCYRFLVAGYESKPATTLKRSPASFERVLTIQTPLNAQKVLFFDCTAAGSNATVQGWLSSSETIVLLDDECTELLRALKDRNAAVPPSMQSLGLMRTSWLLQAQRVSP